MARDYLGPVLTKFGYLSHARPSLKVKAMSDRSETFRNETATLDLPYEHVSVVNEPRADALGFFEVGRRRSRNPEIRETAFYREMLVGFSSEMAQMKSLDITDIFRPKSHI
jgi:hypothetical protein